MTSTIEQTLAALDGASSGTVVLRVSTALFPEECLEAARAAFTEHCRVETATTPQGLEARITILDAHRGTSRDVVGAFLNYLVAASAQRREARASPIP
jgi:hypothetical protein